MGTGVALEIHLILSLCRPAICICSTTGWVSRDWVRLATSWVPTPDIIAQEAPPALILTGAGEDCSIASGCLEDAAAALAQVRQLALDMPRLADLDAALAAAQQRPAP